MLAVQENLSSLMTDLSAQDFPREKAKEILQSLCSGLYHYDADATNGYIDSIINDLDAGGMLNEQTFKRLENNILKYASEMKYMDEAEQSNYEESIAYVIRILKESNLFAAILNNVLECDLNEAASTIQKIKDNTTLNIEHALPSIFSSPSESAPHHIPIVQFSQQPSLNQIIQDQQLLLQGEGDYYIHSVPSAQDSAQALQAIQTRDPFLLLYQRFQNTHQTLQNQPIYQNFGQNPRSASQVQQHHQKLQVLSQVLQQLDQKIQSELNNASRIDALFQRTQQLLREIESFLTQLSQHQIFRTRIRQSNVFTNQQHMLHSPLRNRALPQIEQRFRAMQRQRPTQSFIQTRTTNMRWPSQQVFPNTYLQQLRQSMQNSQRNLDTLIDNVQKSYGDYQRTLPYRQFNSVRNLLALQQSASTSDLANISETSAEDIGEDIHANKIACINDCLTALRDIELQNMSLLKRIDSNTIDIICNNADSGFLETAEALLEAGFLSGDEFKKIIFHPKADRAENFNEICQLLSKHDFIDSRKLACFRDQMESNIDNFTTFLEVSEDFNFLNYSVISAIVELADPDQPENEAAYFVVDFAMNNLHALYKLFNDSENAIRNMQSLCRHYDVFGTLSVSLFPPTKDNEVSELLYKNQELFDQCIKLCDNNAGIISNDEIAKYIKQFVQKKVDEMPESDSDEEVTASVHHLA